MSDYPNRIEEAITEQFGERCPDFDAGCACCQAWAELDRLTAALAEAEKRGWETINKHGIYTASKTVHAHRWQSLRTSGLPIISTWIDEAGQGETSDFSELWVRCVTEAKMCSNLLAYRESGEVLKGAFIEIGAALASNTPVHIVGDFRGMSFLYHPLVKQHESISAAILAMGPKP